jgi:hypothetical protein
VYGSPEAAHVTDATRASILWDAQYNPQMQAAAIASYQNSHAESQRLAAADSAKAWKYGVFGANGPSPATGYPAGGTEATGSLADQEQAIVT